MYGSKSLLALCSVSLLLLASCSHNSPVPTRVAVIPDASGAPDGRSAAGNHVKLFRDQPPWHSYAQDSVLVSLGFTEGPGPDQYEIIASSAMGTTSLVPGQDLVIVSGDQDQTFYDNYADNTTRFDSFVQSGGSLFLEACDEAWNFGVMDSVHNLELPGGVQANFALDLLNHNRYPGSPLLAGIPTDMIHEYASHEWFSGLPETPSDTVYCRDSNDNPTMAVYGFGTGRVLISGQPLEHQYVYGSHDMQQLLPRLLAYFTGKTLPTTTMNALNARVRSMQMQSAGAQPASSARAARR